MNDGHEPIQSPEDRDNWSDYRFKYFIEMPLRGTGAKVYVELRLGDPDPEDPTVYIVSAHRAGV